MKSTVTAQFRKNLEALPESIRHQADRAYKLWRNDPFHTSLQFKSVSQRLSIYSVRVGLGYRALGHWEGDTIKWFWIGPHSEYDTLLSQFP